MAHLTELLTEELIFANLAVSHQGEVIHFLANQLYAAGFVKETYQDAVWQREITHPTGLQTKVCGVAIPHTDTIHVDQERISLAVLDSPVLFQMMGMNDQTVSVTMIFMLAMQEPHGQLEMLQELTKVFQNTHCLQKVLQANDAKEILDILQKR